LQCPTACHHVAQPEVLSPFVVLTSPLNLLKLKILEFANSIPSFSETVHKCLFNKALLSSVQNFAITIEQPIRLQNCYENHTVSV
jgi:hypothetical protein